MSTARTGSGEVQGGVHRAGPFLEWLERMRAALRGSTGMDVPCGECTGCCISGYSIQLRPEDRAARAVVPREALLQAAGFPAGHHTLPARADGTCAMLSAGRCTIYAQRPQTCLDYDCRIFAAAGIDAGGADKRVINERVRAWRFDYPTPADRLAHEAVRAAAAFIANERASFEGVNLPSGPSGIAVLAIKAYTAFLEPGAATRSPKQTARAMLAAGRSFETGD